MSGITIGLIGLGGLLLMLVVRIHIAVAMFVAGAAIYVVMNHGEIVGELSAAEAGSGRLGLMMGGVAS